jgi:hypothetical protein
MSSKLQYSYNVSESRKKNSDRPKVHGFRVQRFFASPFRLLILQTFQPDRAEEVRCIDGKGPFPA